MSKTIGINDLSSAISGALNEYSEFVTDETKKVIKKAGREAAAELKETSPKRTGKYAQSWKQKTASETSTTIHVSVYAGGKEYRKTHLLENGHAKRGGGRVAGIRHIAPVDEKVAQKIMEQIKRQV